VFNSVSFQLACGPLNSSFLGSKGVSYNSLRLARSRRGERGVCITQHDQTCGMTHVVHGSCFVHGGRQTESYLSFLLIRCNHCYK
jgi:hypothetical protein